MLSDSERRTLDATAALIALDDPRLAAQLGQHRITPPRNRPGRGAPTPSPRPRSRWRIRPAAWPPIVMVVLCLTLLILPGLLVGQGHVADTPVPGASTAYPDGRTP